MVTRASGVAWRTYPGGMSRRVLLARPRGYCAGVDRAVQTVERALDLYGAPIYVRKQIVHNAHVVRTLEARGAIFVDHVRILKRLWTDDQVDGTIDGYAFQRAVMLPKPVRRAQLLVAVSELIGPPN